MGIVEVVAAASGGDWDLYRDDRGLPVVRIEIQSAGSSEHERKMIMAEVKALMKAATRGELKPHLDIRHIQRVPLIFELRWELGGDGVVPLQLWRLYFGWHSNRGPLRLALKFGGKPYGPTGRVVQDGHIDEAWSRYKSWLARP